MNPNAEFLMHFSNLNDNDFDESPISKMLAINVLQASDAAALSLAAATFHANDGDVSGAPAFARLMIELAQEFKSKHGDGFDVPALVKAINEMM